MTEDYNKNFAALTDWASFGIACGYVLVDHKLTGDDLVFAIREIGRVSGQFNDCACGAYKYENLPHCPVCDS